MRNLGGTLTLGKWGDFRFSEGTRTERLVGAYLLQGTDTHAFTAEYEAEAFSLFGEVFGGVKSYGPFTANGTSLSSLTVHAPKEAQVRFFHDSANPAGVFPLGLHNAFHFNHLQASFAYELPGQGKLARFLFLALGLLAALAAAQLRFRPWMRKLEARHFALGLLLVFALAFQLAFLLGEARPVGFVLDESGAFDGLTGMLSSDRSPFHLAYTLARSGAIGPVIIGASNRCGTHYGYLTPLYTEFAHAAENIFLGEGLRQETPCGKEWYVRFQGRNPGVVSLEEALQKMRESSAQPERGASLPGKVLVALMHLSAFLAAGLVTFTALGLRPGLDLNGHRKLALAGLTASVVLAFTWFVLGFLMRQPLTYHGGTGQGFTLASMFWPGVLGEGHALTLIMAALGAGLALMAGKHAHKLEPRVVLACLALLFFMLALPQTSYLVKRNLISFTCAGCLQDETGEEWSGALVKLVAPLSQGKAWALLEPGNDAETKTFFEEIGKLRYQQRTDEALALLQEFVQHNQGKPAEAEALYVMGGLLQAKGNSREAVESFAAGAKKHPGHARAAASLYNAGTIALSLNEVRQVEDHLERLRTDYKASPYHPPGLYYLGIAYRQLGENEAANAAFTELIQGFPDHPMAEPAQKQLGGGG